MSMIPEIKAQIAALQQKLFAAKQCEEARAQGVNFFYFRDRHEGKARPFKQQLDVLREDLVADRRQHLELICEGGRFHMLVGLDGFPIKASFDPRLWSTDDAGDLEFLQVKVKSECGDAFATHHQQLHALCTRIARLKIAIGNAKAEMNRVAPVTRCTVVALQPETARFAAAVWRRDSNTAVQGKPDLAALRNTAMRRLQKRPIVMKTPIPDQTSQIRDRLRDIVFNTPGHSICIRGPRV